MSSLFCIVWAGNLDIFTVCPDVDLLCWLCIYSNIFVIGRQKSLKVHVALIYFFDFETYRLIARQLNARQKLLASLNLLEIYVEIIKMSSPSQNITSYPSNFQGTPAMPMPMGYEQFQPPSSNLNAKIQPRNNQIYSMYMFHLCLWAMNNLNPHRII